jgi:glycosyltransferase involved in cell wall biosynthesis
VSDAALGDAVVFCGQQSNVRPFYAMADAFALPSLSEGSPNALLEAMAAGVPSVATRVGGVPEIATDRETALLVYPSNPTDLAAALEALLADRETAGEMALRAKQHVLDRFSPVAQTEALRRVYLDALDKPR